MGYTTYFQFDLETDEGVWEETFPKIAEDARRIISAAKKQGIKIAGSDGKGKPEITKSVIALNGKGEEAYESFILTPYEGEGWDHFCKTARMPYDLVVSAILIRAKERSGRSITIQSDGHFDEDQWQAAARLIEEVFGYTPSNPLKEPENYTPKKIVPAPTCSAASF
jgi:hypothetical protein